MSEPAPMDELIVGYGSLLSYKGLLRTISNEETARVKGVWKLSHQDPVRRIACGISFKQDASTWVLGLDIDNYLQPRARRVVHQWSEESSFESLLINLGDEKDLLCHLSLREGFLLMFELIERAEWAKKTVGEYIHDLYQHVLREHGPDPDALSHYENRLYTDILDSLRAKAKEAGEEYGAYVKGRFYESISGYLERRFPTEADRDRLERWLDQNIETFHSGYLPYPVLVDDRYHGLIYSLPLSVHRFFHPPGETSVKKDRPYEDQVGPITWIAGYWDLCFLGGVHGIDIRDLLDRLPSDSPEYQETVELLSWDAILDEYHRFRDLYCRSHETYWEHFGPLITNLAYSGLLEKYPHLHGPCLERLRQHEVEGSGPFIVTTAAVSRLLRDSGKLEPEVLVFVLEKNGEVPGLRISSELTGQVLNEEIVLCSEISW